MNALPKSHNRSHDLVTPAVTKYQWQTVKGSGSVIAGSLKYWLLACTNKALPALAHGPDDWEAGMDGDVRDPSFPDTSARKFVGLKG
jgi:hypothetical protein